MGLSDTVLFHGTKRALFVCLSPHYHQFFLHYETNGLALDMVFQCARFLLFVTSEVVICKV